MTSPFSTSGWGQTPSLADRLRQWQSKTQPQSKPQVGGTRPPAGYYDPALDAAERAGQRGLGDLRIDTDTANERASSAYVRNTGRLGEDRDTSLAALLRSKTRGHEDSGLARGRGKEDFDTAVAGRRRSYTELGAQQGESAASMGVSGGGTLAAALARRTENEGIEAAGQERDFSRFNQDLDIGDRRLDEDYDTGVGAVNRGYGRGMEDEGTAYQYGVDDRALGLARGEREQVFFGQDTATQAAFQGAQAGYRPPVKKPKKKGHK